MKITHRSANYFLGLIITVMVHLFNITPVSAITLTKKCVIVDTEGSDALPYRLFMAVLGNEFKEVTYVGVGEALNANFQKELSHYDAAFFLLGQDILEPHNGNTMHADTKYALLYCAFANPILNLITQFSALSGKLIGFFATHRYPHKSSPEPWQAGSHDREANFVAGALSSNMRNVDNMELGRQLRCYLTQPVQNRRTFETTAQPARTKIIAFNQAPQILENPTKTPAEIVFLPLIDTDTPPVVKELWPLALWMYNQQCNNYIFVSSKILTHFAGITESSALCPLSRQQSQICVPVYEAFARALHQACAPLNAPKVKAIIDDQGNENVFGCAVPRELRTLVIEYLYGSGDPKTINPYTVVKHSNHTVEIDRSIPEYFQSEQMPHSPKEVIAFMRIEELMDKKAAPSDTIKGIIALQPDYLWMELFPEWYYSPIAFKESRKKLFLETLETFVVKLDEECKKAGITPPQILVDTNFINNFHTSSNPKLQQALRNKTLPQDSFCYGLYGSTYRNTATNLCIPNPICQELWTQEILSSLEQFMKDWTEIKQRTKHSIELGGLLLGMTLYGREPEVCSLYLNTMGYSPANIKKFTGNRTELKPDEVADFNLFLQTEAKGIGTLTQTVATSLIPNGRIFMYLPTIPMSHYFKGLLQGLSAPTKPVTLCTSKARLNPKDIYTLVTDHKIFANHIMYMPLSKMDVNVDWHTVNALPYNDGLAAAALTTAFKARPDDWQAGEFSQKLPGTRALESIAKVVKKPATAAAKKDLKDTKKDDKKK